MDKLTQQRAALSHLLAEKQKLLETQEHLNRLRQSDAMTQVTVDPVYLQEEHPHSKTLPLI